MLVMLPQKSIRISTPPLSLSSKDMVSFSLVSLEISDAKYLLKTVLLHSQFCTLTFNSIHTATGPGGEHILQTRERERLHHRRSL